MALQTTVTLGGTPLGSSDMLPVYIKKKLLPVLEKKLVFHQLGDAEDLPAGSGKTVRWLRYDRVGAPFVPLTEGVTPTTFRDQPISKVEATVDQWGDIAAITDQAELTVLHKAFSTMQDRLLTQSSEVIDREIQRVLLGGANVLFPSTAVTDRTAITAGDVLNTNTIQRVIANLRDYGGPDWADGFYMGVINPRVEQDIIRDPLYQSTAVYGNQVALMNGEIGRWMGVRWMRSNFIPSINASTAFDVTWTASATTGAESAVGIALDLQVTGLSFEGFETYIGAKQSNLACSATTAQDVLPALPTGIYAYNVYAGPVGGTLTLQAEAVGPGTYRISGNGSSAVNGIAYSTTGRSAPPRPTAGVATYQSYIFARDSFGVVNLSPIEVMITPNTPSDSDPMKQRRKVSWKTMFKAVIKNANFFYRIESASAF